jgi:hypothetical protein
MADAIVELKKRPKIVAAFLVLLAVVRGSFAAV